MKQIDKIIEALKRIGAGTGPMISEESGVPIGRTYSTLLTLQRRTIAEVKARVRHKTGRHSVWGLRKAVRT